MNHPAPVTIPTADNNSGGVEEGHDLSPTSPVDRQRMDRLFANRAQPSELKDKGILKGDPNDALAGKRQDLEKAMRRDRLEKDITNRPSADELVKKGVLSPEDKQAL